MSKTSFSSDLSDKQWEKISPLVPQPKPGGRPAKYDRRTIVNAILYLRANNATWRALPPDFPPFRLVFYYYTMWKNNGVLTKINRCLMLNPKSSESTNKKSSSSVSKSNTPPVKSKSPAPATKVDTKVASKMPTKVATKTPTKMPAKVVTKAATQTGAKSKVVTPSKKPVIKSK